MSSVLDRMVERTRGMLPAAEPRIAASASPRDESAFTATPTNDWQGEIVVEPESRPDTPMGRRRPPPAEVSDGPEEVRPVALSTKQASWKTLTHDAAGERPQAAAAASPVQPPVVARVTRQVAEEVPEVRHAGQEPATPASVDAVERVYEARTAIPLQRAEPASRLANEDVENEAEMSRARTEDRPETLHEHREITISIGSISMEAVPQPAVRIPAAFRPQVSLDAFLQGRQEGRR